MARLAEWSFLIPEIRVSNPAISKFDTEHVSLSTVEKTDLEKKRSGIAHLRKRLPGNCVV